jgi:hypothetical protein
MEPWWWATPQTNNKALFTVADICCKNTVIQIHGLSAATLHLKFIAVSELKNKQTKTSM